MMSMTMTDFSPCSFCKKLSRNRSPKNVFKLRKICGTPAFLVPMFDCVRRSNQAKRNNRTYSSTYSNSRVKLYRNGGGSSLECEANVNAVL